MLISLASYKPAVDPLHSPTSATQGKKRSLGDRSQLPGCGHLAATCYAKTYATLPHTTSVMVHLGDTLATVTKNQWTAAALPLISPIGAPLNPGIDNS